MNYESVIKKLKSMRNEHNIAGMARFGISSKNTLGISIVILRKMAKEIGKDHSLALKLWDSKIHEARILASMIDNPSQVSEKQMEKWVADFDSWDVCDQVCLNLFVKTDFAVKKVFEWSTRKEEFVKRTAFSLIASITVHRKDITGKELEKFLPLIKKASVDERNFVKKSVNWALRQIGKHDRLLHKKALKTAHEILTQDSKSARWIAKDTIRELNDQKIIARIKNHS